MSTSSAQATQTRKVKSLPEDLKKVADRLITKKFGEEVVEQQDSRPFHRPDPTTSDGQLHGYSIGLDPAFSQQSFRSHGPGGHTIRPGRDMDSEWREGPGGVRSRCDFPSGRQIFACDVRYPTLPALRDAVDRVGYATARRPNKLVINSRAFRDMGIDVQFASSLAWNHGASVGRGEPIARFRGMDIVIDPSVDVACVVVET